MIRETDKPRARRHLEKLLLEQKLQEVHDHLTEEYRKVDACRFMAAEAGRMMTSVAYAIMAEKYKERADAVAKAIQLLGDLETRRQP